jgi:hypothetical protein
MSFASDQRCAVLVGFCFGLTAVSCAPSRSHLAKQLHRGSTESAVIATLGEPVARLRSDKALLRWANAPCRPERISEAWPYHYKLPGAVIVFLDSSRLVECVVRTEDVGEGLPAISLRDGGSPNRALKLMKPANERAPRHSASLRRGCCRSASPPPMWASQLDAVFGRTPTLVGTRSDANERERFQWI